MKLKSEKRIAMWVVRISEFLVHDSKSSPENPASLKKTKKIKLTEYKRNSDAL
jgi:hypothetical protein